MCELTSKSGTEMISASLFHSILYPILPYPSRCGDAVQRDKRPVKPNKPLLLNIEIGSWAMYAFLWDRID